MTGLGGAALLNGFAVLEVVVRLVHLTIMARVLPPEAFGLGAMALVAVFMVSGVSDFGMSQAIVREETPGRTLVSSVFWVQALAAAVLTAVTYGLSNTLAALYGRPDAAALLQGAALVLLLSGLSSVPRALLLRARRFGAMVLCESAGVGGAAAASLALAYAGWGAWALVAQFVVQFALRVVAYFAASRFVPASELSPAALRKIWPFGRGVMGAQLVDTLASYVDRWIVGSQLSAAALGIYQQAYTINHNLGHLVVFGPMTALYPEFSHVQRDRTRLSEAYLAGTRVLGAVAFPMFAGLAAVADPAIAVLLGTGSAWDWSAVGAILPAVCVAGAVQSVTALNVPLLMAVNAPNAVFRASVVTALGVVVCLTAGAQSGVLGAAIGYAAAFVASGAIVTRMAARRLGLTFADWGDQIARSGACALAMAGLVSVLGRNLEPDEPLVKLLILIPFGVVVYAGPLLLLDRVLAGRLVSAMTRVQLRALIRPGGRS